MKKVISVVLVGVMALSLMACGGKEEAKSEVNENIVSEEQEIQTEDNQEDEMMEEELFLGLRKKSGVSIAKFEEKFGVSIEERYGQIVTELCQHGLLVPDDDLAMSIRIMDELVTGHHLPPLYIQRDRHIPFL